MRTITLSRDDLSELAATVLGQGAMLAFGARGGSMVPFIREGDMLTVAPVAESELRLGAVVLYRSKSGALLAHRAISRNRHRDRWLIRGDASWDTGEWIAFGQVLGCVVSIERRQHTRRLDTFWSRAWALAWHRARPWSLRAYALATRLRRDYRVRTDA